MWYLLLFERKLLNRRQWIATGILALAAAFFCKGEGGMELLKRGFLLELLIAAAWMDAKRRKVPNRLLVSLLLCRVGLYPAELLLGREIFWRNMVWGLAETVLVLFLLLLVRGVSHRGLGFGDIKLLGVASLFTGGFQALLGLLFGLWLAAPAALGQLVWKKGGAKRRIAFAPYLSGGVGVALLTMTMLTGCGGTVQNVEQSENALMEDLLTVTYLDVGKGDAILLELSGETMLIDTGYEETADILLECLEEKGIENLDYLVITHFDKDHVGGADRVLEAVRAETVLQPDYDSDSKQTRQYLEALEAAGLEAVRVTDTLEGTLAGAAFTVYPPREEEYEEEDNDFSLVLSLTYGEERFLFAGDCERVRLEELMNEADLDLQHQVLKVPHHGREEKNSEAFLQAVSPELAVITCSEDNMPDGEIRIILKQVGATTFLTSQGTVTVTTDGGSLKVTQEKT